MKACSARTWGGNIQYALRERNLSEGLCGGKAKWRKVWKSGSNGRRYKPINNYEQSEITLVCSFFSTTKHSYNLVHFKKLLCE